jgi:Holliday junction resolvase-like predicted endonuclease
MGNFPAHKAKAQKDLSQSMITSQEPALRVTTSEPQGGLMAVQSAGNQAMNQRAREIQSASANMSLPVQGNTSQLVSKESPANDLIKAPVSGYELNPTTIEEMRNDVTRIIKELKAVFPDRALIVSLLSKWEGRDQKLSSSLGAPHLDKVFMLLELTRFEKATWRTAWMSLERKALDELIYVMNRTTLADIFRHQMQLSLAYRDYAPEPEISAIWQWEAMLAAELFDHVENDNYTSAREKLNKVNITDRDDVSVALVSRISDKKLFSIAKSKDGNAFLTRLYDELSSGDYGEDERHQAERIFNAKNGVFATNKDDLEEGLLNTSIKTFPRRKTGITVGLLGAPAAYIRARRGKEGYIWVQVVPEMGARFSPAYRKEIETLGEEYISNGYIEVPEDEIVKVIQYDEGGIELYCPAFHLLQISNEDTTHTFQKIGEVAGYALMFGPGAAAEGGIEAVTFAAKAARFIRIADIVAGVVGGVTSVLLEHRGWLIKEFGRPLVEAIDRINSAIMIYGFVRMATQMPRLVADYRKAFRAWRKDVQERKKLLESVEEEWSAVTKFDDANQGLDKAIRDTQVANNNFELPEEGANLPSKSTQEASISTRPPSLEGEAKVTAITPEREPKISVKEMEIQDAMSKVASRRKLQTKPELDVSVAEMESVEAVNEAANQPKPQTESEAQVAENALPKPPSEPATHDASRGAGPLKSGLSEKEVQQFRPIDEIEAPQSDRFSPHEAISEPTEAPGAPKTVETAPAPIRPIAGQKISAARSRFASPDEVTDSIKRIQENEDRIRILEKQLDSKTRSARRNAEKMESEIRDLRDKNDFLREEVKSLTPAKADEPIADLERRWFKQREGESLDIYRERMAAKRDIVEDEARRVEGKREIADRYDELMSNIEERAIGLEEARAEYVATELKRNQARGKWVSTKEAARRQGLGEPRTIEDLEIKKQYETAEKELERIRQDILILDIGIDKTGILGETLAKEYLQSQHYTNIRSIQNSSGHGIDIVAELNGETFFFEVKSSETSFAPGLSERQRNIKWFVEDVLERSNSLDAKDLLRRIKSGELEVKGSIIEVTDIDRLSRKRNINPRNW